MISGPGGIGKTDTAGSILLLNGANTFTGPTQWNTVGGQGAVGNIQLGNALALQNSTVIENSAGGSLTFSGSIGTFTLGGLSGSVNQALTDLNTAAVTLQVGNNNANNTYSGVLSGGGALAKIGTGNLTLTGANTYSGTTAVSSGTLQIGGAGDLGGGNYSAAIANSGALVLNTSTNQTLAGAISGGGQLYQLGGNLTILAGSNTYSGGTTISAGTLQVGNGGNTGTLGTAAVANNGVLIFSRSDTGLNVASNINGSGSVVQAGAGLTTLSGSNTYGGGTTINAGYLAFANTGAVPAGSGNVTINPNGTLLATGAYNSFGGWLSSGNIATTSSGVLALYGGTDSQPLSLANYPTLALGASGSATYSGALTQNATSNTYFGGSGTLTVAAGFGGGNGAVVSGPGAVIFAGSNTYSGTTTVNNGGTLYLNNPAGQALQGNVQIGTGTAGSLAKLILTASNQFGANTVINETGVLNGNAYFRLLGNNQAIAGLSGTGPYCIVENSETENNIGPATLTINNAANYTYSGYLQTTFSGTNVSTLSVVENGPGVQTFQGTNIKYTGNTTVNGGTLQIQDAAAFTAANGVATGFSVGAAPANTLTVNSPGVLQFNVGSPGITSDGSQSALGTSGTTTITGNGVFQKTGTGILSLGGEGSATYAVNMAMTGGTIDIEGGGLKNGGWTGNVWTNNKASMYIASGGTLDVWDAAAANSVFIDGLNGAGTVNKGQNQAAGVILTVGVNNGSGTFSGLIENTNTTGGLIFAKTGTGTEVLTGPNTYSSGTTINGGVLSFGNSGLGTGNITFSGNATLQWYGGNTQDISAKLQPIPLGLTATLDTNGNNVAFASAVTGSGSLYKTGSGTLTLSTSAKYIGATTVNAGVLQLGTAGALAAVSPVTVHNGGTLQLVGNASLPSTSIALQPGGVFDASQATSGFLLNAGQTLSAGRTGTPAPDLLGNVTLNGGVLNIGIGAGTIATLSTDGTSTLALSGGTVNFDLTSTATSNSGVNDMIDAANLSLSGTTTIDINPVNLALSSGTYNLFNFSGTLSGGVNNFKLVGLNSSAGRQTFSLVTNGSSNAAVQLAVNGYAANLLWTGTAGTAWDVTTTTNWSNLSLAGSPGDMFYNNDLVTFDDTGTTGSVALAGSLSPGWVTFNNNHLAYVLSGSGSITGLGGLTVAGTGTVVLANSNGNSYSGATAINSGLLVLGSSNAVANSIVGINVNNGLGFLPGVGTFNLNGLSGSGALSLSDTTGAAIALAIGGNGAGSTFSGVISGPGSLTKNGGGTFTLASAGNSFSGGLAINAGAVQLANSAALSNLTATLNPGGTLGFAAGIGNFSVGGLAGGGGTVATIDAGLFPVALSLGGNNQNSTFSGMITGGGSLTKIGNGLLTLAGTNIVYTGNTTVTNGTLEVYNTRNFSNSTVNTTPANTINIASGAMFQIYADNTTGNVGDYANQGFGNNTGTTISGAGVFQKQGNGILASGVSGANESLIFAMSPGGVIDIENGMLRNGGWSNTTWTNNQASMYIGSSGTLDLWDGKGVTIDALNGAGTVTKEQGTGNVLVTVGVAGGSGSFSGTIQNPQTSVFGNNVAGSTVSLTKAGSGTQVISGNVSYSGPTTVSGGALLLSNTTSTYSSQTTVSGGLLVIAGNNTTSSATTISGGTLQVGNGGSTGSINSTSAITNNGTLVYNRASGTVTAPAISGAGNLVKTGAGTLQLTQVQSYTGATLISGGVLQLEAPPTLSAAGAGTALVDFDPSNPANYTLSGGSLTQLTNLTNSLTGGTVGSATVQTGHAAPTLTTNNPAFNGLTTVHFNGAQALGGFNLSAMNSSSYTIFAVQAVSSTGNCYFLGTNQSGVTNGCLHFGYRSNGQFTLAQYADDLNATAPGYNGTEVASQWTGMLNTASGHSLTMNGTLLSSNGSLSSFTTLSSTNCGIIGTGFAYNAPFIGDVGEVLIYNSALTATQQAAIQQYLMGKWEGVLPDATPVTISGGGTLDLNNNNQTIGSLSSSDPTTAVLLESAQLSVGNLNANTTFAGSINGAGSLAKIGTGLLTLTGSNAYGGGTVVAGGTLQLGAAAALGTGGLTANGGLVNLNGFSLTLAGSNALASLSGAAGTITTSVSGLATVTVNQSATTTFGGAINDGAGQIALVKMATGSLTLAGTSNYSGGTTLSNGTLAVTNPASLGAAAGALAVNAATLEVANSFADSRNISLTSPNSAIQVDAGQVYANSGTIAAGAANSLNVNGAGTSSWPEAATWAGSTSMPDCSRSTGR